MTELARIEAGQKQFADVFFDKYAFTIPSYHRSHAWEAQQVTELLDDLLDAMDRHRALSVCIFLAVSCS